MIAVVGMGVQGAKRLAVARSGIRVDPVAADVDYADLREVPLDAYQAAYVCTPDGPKQEIVRYLVEHGKHALIEKPFTLDASGYREIAAIQERTHATVYVAYNHRFEPHIAAVRDLLEAGALGDIYTVSLSYGNGTAALVRQSPWRDAGLGVIADLGSHLLDIVDFWWGLEGREVDFVDAQRYENHAWDHALFRITGAPTVFAETTLLSWRNDFTCRIRGSAGSVDIASLCKWGPSSLTVRGRVLPSGRPDERTTTLVLPDPTWALEHEHFQQLIARGDRGNLRSSEMIADILTRARALLPTSPETGP